MEVYQCRNCEYQNLTMKYFCPKCRETEFSKVNVNNNGEVYSYTTIHVAPPKYAQYAPYQVVLVQLNDQLKVTGFMEEEVNIGDQVTYKEFREGAYIFEKSV